MAVSGVDFYFPKTEFSLDLDPCSECSHCGFQSYSTELLENHVANNHKGVPNKFRKKIISVADSAKVRQADAVFYSVTARTNSEKSSSIQELSDDLRKMKTPSSSLSNTVVSENQEDIKDIPLDTVLNQDASGSCLTFGTDSLGPIELGNVEYAKHLSRKLMSFFQSGVKQEVTALSKWTPKVETLYCLSCPFNSVHLENLRCHMFSVHASSIAIARNSCDGNDFTPDPTNVWTFFCVKESCSHHSNLFATYEKHLMTCCPVSQKFPEEITQRLNSTLSFLQYFHRKKILHAASGFQKYVYSFYENFPDSKINSMQIRDQIEEIIQANIEISCLSGNTGKAPNSTAGPILRRSRRQNEHVSYNDNAEDEMIASDVDDDYHVDSDELSDDSESD